MSRSRPQQGETWWWHHDVLKFIKKKKKFSDVEMVGRKCGRSTCEKNPWDRMVYVEMVEGSVEPFAMNKVKKAQAVKENGTDSKLTGIVMEHLVASLNGKQVILQIANAILDGKDMPYDWRTITVFPIYKKKVAL